MSTLDIEDNIEVEGVSEVEDIAQILQQPLGLVAHVICYVNVFIIPDDDPCYDFLYYVQ